MPVYLSIPFSEVIEIAETFFIICVDGLNVNIRYNNLRLSITFGVNHVIDNLNEVYIMNNG